jgi:hypothetical protein
MNSKPNSYIEISIGFVFAFLVLIYCMDYYSLHRYILVKNSINYKESFVNLDGAEVDQSYSLLNGVLPLKDKQIQGTLNSQSCYDNDFNTRLEKVGNYIQRTNNYRHKDPESCSSPFQEFVTAYYKVEPLA